jgi:IS605 OrfB family transposase
MLIRTSNHTLKYSNQEKIDLYWRLVSDYKELLQEYINLIHSKQLPLKVMLTCKYLPTLNNITHSKWKQLCYREASEIYRGLLAKKKKFTKSEIKTHSINLNTDLWDIEYTPDGEFDGFIRIKTPYFQCGKKRAVSLKIPFRFHKQSNKFKDDNWVMNSSLRLSDNFSFSFYWNKEEATKVEEGTQIGIDCGYKKLIACSDGEVYGKELEEVYKKISRKVQGSKAFKRALNERDNLTNKAVNDFYRNHSNVKDVICEKLKYVKHKSKFSKKFNNKLQRWSYTKTLNRLEQLSETKGFRLRYINPTYTSQTCSHCGVVIKSNRNGETYHCSVCGVELDADVNAAINILRRGVYSPSNDEA